MAVLQSSLPSSACSETFPCRFTAQRRPDLSTFCVRGRRNPSIAMYLRHASYHVPKTYGQYQNFFFFFFWNAKDLHVLLSPHKILFVKHVTRLQGITLILVIERCSMSVNGSNHHNPRFTLLIFQMPCKRRPTSLGMPSDCLSFVLGPWLKSPPVFPYADLHSFKMSDLMVTLPYRLSL